MMFLRPRCLALARWPVIFSLVWLQQVRWRMLSRPQ